jgi:hypothetical protein
MKAELNIAELIQEANAFCLSESTFQNNDLYGITDGKAVGTYIEQKFKNHLRDNYSLVTGSSASGIDLPSENIMTDIKVTSIKQPQSSCPFKDAKQKIYGLGYNLLIFVYDKKDDPITKTCLLNFVSCAFVDKKRTADYTTTFRLREMVHDNANEEDIIAYLNDKNIPADEITIAQLAKQILAHPPELGYLTISNALQWRLQYSRIVDMKDMIDGIIKIIQ